MGRREIDLCQDGTRHLVFESRQADTQFEELPDDLEMVDLELFQNPLEALADDRAEFRLESTATSRDTSSSRRTIPPCTRHDTAR